MGEKKEENERLGMSQMRGLEKGQAERVNMMLSHAL